MNPILQNKLEKLKNANDYECWYLVKQPTAFDSLCYLVSFLEKYQGEPQDKSLQTFISEQIIALKTTKPALTISDNYRALRVAAFFGLITMTSTTYDEAIVTDTYKEITARCKGEYEKTNLYTDIIQRQIEKMFISSEIDEQRNGVRKKYRLYPVMLLYKVLVELGRTTGEYGISMTEYRYLVATTETFSDFLDTLLLIKLLRNEPTDAAKEFEQFKSKFDNRLILALKQLDTLEFADELIAIKEDKIREVAEKVYRFEENPDIFTTSNYLGFLGSTKSLFELETFESHTNADAAAQENIDESLRIGGGRNVILYGVPGCGKSWTIEHEYCKAGTQVERVVFHPDYTNADFIGQILPVVDAADKMVTYEFVPGPFTTIVKEAYRNPNVPFALIIEEINRGNAPAIFGDVFQLLDRTAEEKVVDGIRYPRGTSEYGIVNENMAKAIYTDARHKVRIPSNLSILATMNTSDQNVFTLDTAFQRRWSMRLIENSFDNVRLSLANAQILDTTVPWKTFCETVNSLIVGNSAKMASAEDKRLGVYFIHEADLKFDKRAMPTGSYSTTSEEWSALLKAESCGTLGETQAQRLEELRTALLNNRQFPEKVIKYLWDDAFKFYRETLFDTETMDNLEKVIKTFVFHTGFDRFKIFKENVREMLNPGQV